MTNRNSFIMEHLIKRASDASWLFEFSRCGDAVIKSETISEGIIRTEEFFTQLGYFVDLWKFMGVKGVDVVVHSRHAHLVPELVSRGYEFYKLVDKRLVLNRWIATGPSRLPLRKNTLIFVSGLVVDNSGRILMIREKSRSDCWKFPGGIPLENESIYDTAKRTVKEKTGVTGVPKTIVSIIHNNKVELLYGTVTGTFFVCLMKYTSLGDAAANGDVLESTWLKRSQLQEFHDKKFFKPHMEVFNLYERLIESGSISPTGDVQARSMAYNFRR